MARSMLAISHGCISLIEKAGQFAVFIISSSGLFSVNIQMLVVFTVKSYDSLNFVYSVHWLHYNKFE